MFNQRYVLFGGGLCLFMGVMGLVVQVFAAGMVMSAANQTMSGMRKIERLDDPNPKFARGLVITGAEEGRPGSLGYAALTRMDQIHDGRRVRVSLRLRQSDLLNPGETLPAPELAHAFVTARSARVADAECRRLKRSFAAKCDVDNVHAEPEDDGTATLTFRLNFTQQDDFGAVTAKRRAAYVEIEEQVDVARTVFSSPDAAARHRSTVYDGIRAFCAKIRATQGNCAITRVEVMSDAAGGGGAGYRHGRGEATFSTLQTIE